MASATEVAARVRAARAWSGKEQGALATELDMSAATLRRLEAGQRAASRAELERIAKLTNVPLRFLEDGFGPEAASGESGIGDQHLELLREKAALEIEVERLRARVGESESLRKRVTELEEEIATLRAQPVDPDELRHQIRMAVKAELDPKTAKLMTPLTDR